MTARPPLRLLPRPLPAAVVLAASAVAFAVLAVLVHDRGDNRADLAVFVRIRAHVPVWIVDKTLHLTDPILIVALFVALVIWALARRHWTAVVLAVVVPIGSVLMTEHVLKPLVHRTDTGALAFPSGHETGVASFACVAGALLLASNARRLVKVTGLVVLAADVVLAAVALVGNAYHYATDTIGSLLWCLVVTITVALALDAVSGSRRTAPARDEVPPRVHPEVRSATSGRTTV